MIIICNVIYLESSELKFFDDCRKMNLSVTVSDPSIFQVVGTSGKYCVVDNLDKKIEGITVFFPKLVCLHHYQ